MSLSNAEQPKRGFLANILTIPPLIYPFQYNPVQVSDSKRNEFTTKSPTPILEVAMKGTLGMVAALPEFAGRTFSKAEMKKFKSEGDRTINFKFIIDGREQRPGEPGRRRNDAGDILGDLAVLHSFMYPKFGDLLDVMSLATGDKKWQDIWFSEPPTATLVLGSTSIEGFMTELKITETMFNSDLNPTRAEVEVTLIERIGGVSFMLDSVKRIGRMFYHTAYEDIGDVII